MEWSGRLHQPGETGLGRAAGYTCVLLGWAGAARDGFGADVSELEERIPVAELVNGAVYSLRSRNLLAGAYRAAAGGFIGIRMKFGSRYLFEEYDYAGGPPYGTATPLAVLGVVPEGVELREYTDPYCAECGRATVFLPDDPAVGPTPGWNYHADDLTPMDRRDDREWKADEPWHSSCVSTYKPLFDFLEQFEHHPEAER
jgi:hypothetical protein